MSLVVRRTRWLQAYPCLLGKTSKHKARNMQAGFETNYWTAQPLDSDQNRLASNIARGAPSFILVFLV